MFEGRLMDVSRMFEGCLKSVSRIFEGCLKDVRRMFEGIMKQPFGDGCGFCSRRGEVGATGG